MNSNVNMIHGDLRHMDRSTTITNRDAFNIESTVTEQQLPPTTSLVVGNDGKAIRVVGFLKHLEHWFINGFIQRQPPWYLKIPPLRIMNKILTELQVRNKFWCTFKIGTYKKPSNLPDVPRSRPVEMISQPMEMISRSVEMISSVHDTVSKIKHYIFILTSIPSGEDFTFWCRWTWIPLHHSTDEEEQVHIYL